MENEARDDPRAVSVRLYNTDSIANARERSFSLFLFSLRPLLIIGMVIWEVRLSARASSFFFCSYWQLSAPCLDLKIEVCVRKRSEAAPGHSSGCIHARELKLIFFFLNEEYMGYDLLPIPPSYWMINLNVLYDCDFRCWKNLMHCWANQQCFIIFAQVFFYFSGEVQLIINLNKNKQFFIS